MPPSAPPEVPAWSAQGRGWGLPRAGPLESGPSATSHAPVVSGLSEPQFPPLHMGLPSCLIMRIQWGGVHLGLTCPAVGSTWCPPWLWPQRSQHCLGDTAGSAGPFVSSLSWLHLVLQGSRLQPFAPKSVPDCRPFHLRLLPPELLPGQGTAPLLSGLILFALPLPGSGLW